MWNTCIGDVCCNVRGLCESTELKHDMAKTHQCSCCVKAELRPIPNMAQQDLCFRPQSCPCEETKLCGKESCA